MYKIYKKLKKVVRIMRAATRLILYLNEGFELIDFILRILNLTDNNLQKYLTLEGLVLLFEDQHLIFNIFKT